MLFLNCFDTVRKSIWSVKKLSDEELAWLCLDQGANDFKTQRTLRRYINAVLLLLLWSK